MSKWLLLILLSLTSLFSQAMTPPPANEVFQLAVKPHDPDSFLITWHIKSGYFLYSDRIKITGKPDDIIQMGTIRFPIPTNKTDKQGRTFPVYRNTLFLSVPVLGHEPGEAWLDLRFQGCADDGFCYPPEMRKIKLTINTKLALSTVSLEESAPLAEAPELSDESRQIENFSRHGWFLTILSFFGFGLLLSFTPCILPMVPVLSGIIVGHGKSLSTSKAFFLSLSYVLSMSVTYAVVGATVSLLGSNLQIIMQAPWVIALFSLLFVVLALSMFGLFELKLPISWQAKLAGASHRQSTGHYLGAAIMGCLSTLILSPCITAPLIGVLGYIAQTGNILFGTITLFFLSLGMGTPLLLIGTSAGKWLPSAGLWMNTVKGFFGIMLLAVAIYLLSRILPASFIMVLWAILLVFSGISAGALLPARSRYEKFCQGAGILLLLYGLLILIGASLGSKDPLQPLAVLRSKTETAIPEHSRVKNLADIETALSKTAEKPVILDFYADWCASCKLIESTTLTDPQIKNALKNFRLLKVDITANNAADQAIMRKYKVVAPPTFVFFNQAGEELPELRLVGEVPAAVLLKKLGKAGSP